MSILGFNLNSRSWDFWNNLILLLFLLFPRSLLCFESLLPSLMFLFLPLLFLFLPPFLLLLFLLPSELFLRLNFFQLLRCKLVDNRWNWRNDLRYKNYCPWTNWRLLNLSRILLLLVPSIDSILDICSHVLNLEVHLYFQSSTISNLRMRSGMRRTQYQTESL